MSAPQSVGAVPRTKPTHTCYHVVTMREGDEATGGGARPVRRGDGADESRSEARMTSRKCGCLEGRAGLGRERRFGVST